MTVTESTAADRVHAALADIQARRSAGEATAAAVAREQNQRAQEANADRNRAVQEYEERERVMAETRAVVSDAAERVRQALRLLTAERGQFRTAHVNVHDDARSRLAAELERLPARATSRLPTEIERAARRLCDQTYRAAGFDGVVRLLGLDALASPSGVARALELIDQAHYGPLSGEQVRARLEASAPHEAVIREAQQHVRQAEAGRGARPEFGVQALDAADRADAALAAHRAVLAGEEVSG